MGCHQVDLPPSKFSFFSWVLFPWLFFEWDAKNRPLCTQQKLFQVQKLATITFTFHGSLRVNSGTLHQASLLFYFLSQAGKLVWQHRRLVWIGKLYVQDCVSPFVRSPDTYMFIVQFRLFIVCLFI